MSHPIFLLETYSAQIEGRINNFYNEHIHPTPNLLETFSSPPDPVPVSPTPQTWHSIEPGDPYQIKKSLIATFSTDNKHMGESIQLVVLFQAAQIERLTDALQEHRNKLRQVSTRELDRHSYEIQIRELATILGESKELSNENGKLKDFIRKQAQELESWKKRLDTTEAPSQSKYESALRQIEVMMQERNQIITEFNNITSSLNTQKQLLEVELRTIKESFSIKTQETKELVQNMSHHNLKMIELTERSQLAIEYEKRIQEYEAVVGRLNVEIQRLVGAVNQKSTQSINFTGRIESLEGEMAKMESSYQQLSRRLEITLEDKQRIHQEFLQMEIKSKEYEKSSWKRSDMEIRLKRTEDELEHLRSTLRSKDIEIKDITSKRHLLEQQLETSRVCHRTTVELLQTRINEMVKAATQFSEMQIGSEGKVKQNQYLSEENHRLKENFRMSTANIQKINTELLTVKKDILELNQENEQLRARLGGLADTNSRLADYDSRVHFLTQEQERLGISIDHKNREIESLKGEIQESRNRNQISIQENEQYKRRIQELGESNRKVQESEGRILALSNEIERLNKLLEYNQKQSLALIRRINEYQGLNQTITNLQEKINKLVNENNVLSSDIKTAQENIVLSSNQFNSIRVENEELRRVVGVLEEQNNRGSQYEIQIRELSEEFERITGILEGKERENSHLLIESNRLRELLNKALGETESFKRKAGENAETQRKLAEYQGKITMLTQDLERLAGSLEAKSTQYQQLFQETLESKSKQISIANESEILKRKLMEAAEIQRKNSEHEHQILMLSSEIERMNGLVSKRTLDNQRNQTQITETKLKITQVLQDNEQLKRRLSELAESNRRVAEYQSQIRELRHENEQILKTLKQKSLNLTRVESDTVDLQSKIRGISQENQELRIRTRDIASLNQSLFDYEQRLTSVGQEMDRLNGVIEIKNKVIHNIEMEKSNLQEQLSRLAIQEEEQEIKLNEMKKLQIRIGDYQERITLLTNEIRRLNQVVDEKISTNHRVESELTEIRVKFNHYSMENEQLRRKVSDMRELTIKFEEYEHKFTGVTYEVGRLNQELEQKIIELRHAQNQMEEYRYKSHQFAHENQELRRRVNESDPLSSQNEQYQNKIRVLQQEMQRLTAAIDEKNSLTRHNTDEVQELRLRVSQFAQENDQLKRRTSETADINSRFAQYQNKIALFSQEIERLNGLIEQKNIIISRSTQELSEFRISYKKMESDLSSAQLRLDSSTDTTVQVPVYLSTIEHQHQQIERLVYENDMLKRQNTQLSLTERHKQQAEHKLRAISQESSQNLSRLYEYEQKVIQITGEFQKLNIVIKEQKLVINQLKQANYELEMALQQLTNYDQNNIILGKEIDRLNNVLEHKNQELAELRGRITHETPTPPPRHPNTLPHRHN